MYRVVTVVNNKYCIVLLKVAKTDLKHSHRKKNKCNYVSLWMLTKLIVLTYFPTYTGGPLYPNVLHPRIQPTNGKYSEKSYIVVDVHDVVRPVLHLYRTHKAFFSSDYSLNTV